MLMQDKVPEIRYTESSTLPLIKSDTKTQKSHDTMPWLFGPVQTNL